jgi:hypothetical protein
LLRRLKRAIALNAADYRNTLTSRSDADTVADDEVVSFMFV